MIRMSRAGRKQQIVKVLYQQYKRDASVMLTVGHIARRIGMRSSTELKKMVRELYHEHQNILSDVSETATRYCWRPMVQVELPERYITINGKQHKVANWVADAREFENA